MEKKRPSEKPQAVNETPATENSNSGLESKVKILTGLCAVLFLWSAFLTYKSFSGSKPDLEQARAEAKALNPTAANPMDPNNPAPIKPTQPSIPEVDPATATTLAFEEPIFDYGKISEGEKVGHVYKFKNTGTKPLIISDARGSCGCTVPQWSKEPLAPGAEGEIKVEFDSKGKAGQQSKTVTITANTIPAQTMLTIKGEVIKLEGGEADKPKTK